MEYCFYGLAACFATTFAATATSENVKLRSLRATAENGVDLRKHLGLSKEPTIQKVRLKVQVNADAPRSTLERCVTRSISLS